MAIALVGWFVMVVLFLLDGFGILHGIGDRMHLATGLFIIAVETIICFGAAWEIRKKRGRPIDPSWFWAFLVAFIFLFLVVLSLV